MPYEEALHAMHEPHLPRWCGSCRWAYVGVLMTFGVMLVVVPLVVQATDNVIVWCVVGVIIVVVGLVCTIFLIRRDYAFYKQLNVERKEDAEAFAEVFAEAVAEAFPPAESDSVPDSVPDSTNGNIKNAARSTNGSAVFKSSVLSAAVQKTAHYGTSDDRKYSHHTGYPISHTHADDDDDSSRITSDSLESAAESAADHVDDSMRIDIVPPPTPPMAILTTTASTSWSRTPAASLFSNSPKFGYV